jgi:hypothetical protein
VGEWQSGAGKKRCDPSPNPSIKTVFYELENLLMRYGIQKIPAVILAGGINTIQLYPGHAPGKKALLRYGGRLG